MKNQLTGALLSGKALRREPGYNLAIITDSRKLIFLKIETLKHHFLQRLKIAHNSYESKLFLASQYSSVPLPQQPHLSSVASQVRFQQITLEAVGRKADMPTYISHCG